MMNDPHVVALEYRIEHGPNIDWSRAVPLAREEDRFRVLVETGRVRFEFKDHHASEEEARDALEADYIPTGNSWSALSAVRMRSGSASTAPRSWTGTRPLDCPCQACAQAPGFPPSESTLRRRKPCAHSARRTE